MNLINEFFDWIFDPHQTSAHSADEAYLAEAVDMLDLERRMRELDRRQSIGANGLNT